MQTFTPISVDFIVEDATQADPIKLHLARQHQSQYLQLFSIRSYQAKEMGNKALTSFVFVSLCFMYVACLFRNRCSNKGNTGK